jgi:hypothetical protein
MLKPPSEYELQQLMHDYDATKAHEYYMRTRKLKGRKKGSSQQPSLRESRQQAVSPRAKQKRELAARIQNLDKKLKDLEALIRKKEHEEASENRKGKAKKERAAKAKDKPQSAAEKAKAAREAKKYRDKHQNKLAAKAKQASGKSGGSTKKATKDSSVSELKTLATKVKGQIAVAKAKLAAL